MKPIDADALMKVIREHDYPLRSHFNSTDNGMFTIGVQQAVDDAPTIDAVRVVRCKDCENWHREVTALNACACAFWSGGKGRVRYTRADDYCSHGEQMDEEKGESK